MARSSRASRGSPLSQAPGRSARGCAGSGSKDTGSLTKSKRSLSEADWQKKSTPEQFYVTREKGTEAPFSGMYLNNKETGMYHCVCCDSPLFSSEKKYCSGTGWPSFSEAYGSKGSDESHTGISRRSDTSLGCPRMEVVCKQCEAHLGHVFPDGPKPTGQKVLHQQCGPEVQTQQASTVCRRPVFCPSLWSLGSVTRMDALLYVSKA